MLDFTKLKLEDVRGVGTIELDLEPGKQAYVFIGENGIGKTSLLNHLYNHVFYVTLRKAAQVISGKSPEKQLEYVFIDAKQRGHIEESIKEKASSWILKTSKASSPFKTNNEVNKEKLKEFLLTLHAIDNQYDPEFLEINEHDSISLKVAGKKTYLFYLSTGFTAIVNLVQAILSTYISKETEGVVLIDEIESHLHLKWQAHIIPKLKELFPNTTFIIATHSPIVISQLEEGEAYKLVREDDGVVRSKKIENPRSNAMIDLLNDAFDIDLNEIAIQRPATQQQHSAKQELLNRIKQRKVAQ